MATPCCAEVNFRGAPDLGKLASIGKRQKKKSGLAIVQFLELLLNYYHNFTKYRDLHNHTRFVDKRV